MAQQHSIQPHALYRAIAAALGLGALSAMTSASDTQLNPTVVTATRTAESLQSVLAPMSVLERADIERLQSRDFTDLVSRLPGVDISRDGGPGALSSLYLRGTNSEHTLFLVDGQRVSSATLGSTSFQFLDPQQIEKIEVVRGPKSSLYGSDAIGGVVQIFTRRSTAEPASYVRAGFGSESTYQVAAGTQGKVDRFRYSAHVSQFFTDGISNLDVESSPGDDDDAYRNSSASFNAGYDFANGAALDINHFYTRTKNEYDDAVAYISQPYAKSWIQTSSAVLQLPFTPIWDATLSVGRTVDDTDAYDKLDLDFFGRTNFRTTRDSASWQNDFAVTDKQTFTIGIDYYEDKLDSSNEYVDVNEGEVIDERDNVAYFAQYLYSHDRFDVQAGFRQDDNEAFGKKNTRDIALGIKLPAQHRLTLSYGTAFKAPTFNDLYFPPDPYGQGNPDLAPQSAKNYEIGVSGDYDTWNWALNGYHNKVDNLIIWLPVDPNDPNNLVWMPNNVAKAKIRGAEFVVNARLQEWLVAASLNYVDPRDESTDNLLPKRAQRSAKLDLDRTFGDWDIGLSWRAYSDRYGDGDNTRDMHTSGYGLLDLRAGYQFSKAWQGQLRLDNVLDKNYSMNRAYGGIDYNQPGFGWLATLTYRL